MAFIEDFKDHRERFSLLLLEPGEIYFEDFSAFYYPPKLAAADRERKKQRGRLRICSKSLVFDPQDINEPIVKLPFEHCSKLEESRLSLFAKGVENNKVAIHCSQTVEMMKENVIGPFEFNKKIGVHLFDLNYCKSEDFLATACQLHRASTLPTSEQDAMIAAIIFSRQSRVTFDTSRLDNLFERIVMETTGERITPLVVNPGRILVTSDRLYFQPFNNVEHVTVMKFKLSDIRRVIKRRFLLRHVGLEVYCSSESYRSDLYLVLASEEERDKLYASIVNQQFVKLDESEQENMTMRWQAGAISNFEYLHYLNSQADRSFNDLTQYPVFPWVLSDYTSACLDLEDSKSYRDLTKPIGALNAKRLERFVERYKDMPEPKFLYGSHYSTPGYILYYLLRAAPEHALCLQNGRFDQADRLFKSVSETWRNVMDLPSDVKELVPEFYMPEMADFLVNKDSLQLGTKQDGFKVNDVELPPWAEDAKDFCRKCQQALESDYVSRHLHHWIDLIFGFKQTGPEAEKAHNVFYYLTYEGAINLDSITNLEERAAMRAQIMEFGQIPKKLFTKPHPARFSQAEPASTQGEPDVQVKNNGEKNVQPDKGEMGFPSNTTSGYKPSFRDLIEKLEEHHRYKLHKDAVTALRISNDTKTIYSVAKDSHLKMFSVEDKKQLRSISLSNMPLSSLAVMPDGKSVLVSSWDNSLYLYSVDFGRIISTIPAHDDAISQLCWHEHSETLLVTASWDASVKLWMCSQVKDGMKKLNADCIAELDHDTGVNCVDVCKDQSLLVCGTKDGTIYQWDLCMQTIIRCSHSHSSEVNAIKFNPDNSQFVSAGEDGYLRVVDVNTGTEVFAKHCQHSIRCLSWEGVLLFVGDSVGNVRIWDMTKVQSVSTLKHDQGVWSLAVCESSSMVLVGCDDGTIVIWKAA